MYQNEINDALAMFFKNLPKYLMEGAAVAVAAHYIPARKMSMLELIIVALTAALTFAVLDILAPAILPGAYMGAGFGIGAKMVGFPGAHA